MSRRGFIAGGLGLGFGILDLERRARAGGLALRAAASELAAGPQPNAVFGLRRPDDLLWLRVELFDIAIDGNSLKAGADATLVLVFQMQSILEQATFLNGVQEDYFDGYQDVADLLKLVPPPGTVRTVPAGLSRLAFAVPPGSEVPFTTDGILGAARTLTPRVVPAAQPVLQPVIKEQFLFWFTRTFRAQPFTGEVPSSPQGPSAIETGIEAPWGLVLSPSEKGAWAHAPQASVAGARTELWHTRLGVRGGDGEPDETDETERVVRAVLNRRPDDPFDPDQMPLTAVNREDIVKATTTYSGLSPDPDEFWPEAVQVESLSLSTLGAFLDVSGNWNPKGFPEGEGPFALEQWKHRMTSGRDQFARVVYRGYLFPFGHRVSLVEETERRFVGGTTKSSLQLPFVGAYLFKRAFIVVRERVKNYGGAYGQPDGGRRLPFRQLRLVTRVTPNLDSRFDTPGIPFPFGRIDPRPANPGPIPDEYQPFLPSMAEQPYTFAFSGTDWDGHKSEFRAPAVFVFHGWWAYDANVLHYVSDMYRTHAQGALRRRALHGQTVAFAPGRGNKSTERLSAGVPARDAAQVVKELVFAPVNAKGTASRLEAADQPAFFPEMQEATVALSAAKEAAGKRVKETSDLGDLVIEYYGRYVTQGFTVPTSASKLEAKNANHGEVYAKVTKALGKSVLRFATNRSGGVVTPNLDIVGLSRTLGPISAASGIGRMADDALDEIAGNKFDPANLLPKSAKLLGVLSLKDVVASMSGFVDAAGNVAEQALQIVNDVGDEVIERRIVWRPDLKEGGLPLLEVNGSSSLAIEALIRVPLNNPQDVQSRTSGDLRNVTIHIFEAAHPFVSIDIRRIGFTQKGTAKPSVVVDIGEVRFGEALNFVKKLTSFMSSRDKPWWIDASAKGVEAGFALEIPNVGVGIFALSNISMRGSLEVPFTGDPVRFCFSFASRDDPFRVSVGIFGGGGFFGLCLHADGFESLEASFEFGLTASIDLGVASGSASMMGGIYYRKDEKNAVLEGYFRISGRLSILGIVSVSIELYLALSYQSTGNKVAGEASVKVRISIGFFSLSKTVSARRTFSENADDPPFGDQMTAVDWSEYSSAFAAVAS